MFYYGVVFLTLIATPKLFCASRDWRDSNFWSGGGHRADEPRDVMCGSYPINMNTTYKIQTTFQQFQPFFQTGLDCTWKFYGSRCYPVISCDLFELAESTDCSSARLEITDEFSVSKRFCGNNGPKNTATGSTILVATFSRSIAIPRKGFSCLVSCAASTTGLDVITKTLPSPALANCSCGIPGADNSAKDNQSSPAHRIVGGKEAPPHYWKWQVALVPKTRSNAFCGGSLVNDRYVVTAAHCVITTGLVALPQAGDVILNAYNIKDTSEPVIRRGIASIHPHPFYDPVSQDYDISIVELNEPVSLVSSGEPSVRTVCLPPRDMWDMFVGKIGTVTGWGVTAEGGKQSMILKEADIPIISNEECGNSYKRNKTAGLTITDRMVCAAYETGGTDACQGDSGGPFVLKRDDGTFMQIGVVSFGEGCARQGKPGVYARVTELNDWIRSRTKQGTWCHE